MANKKEVVLNIGVEGFEKVKKTLEDLGQSNSNLSNKTKETVKWLEKLIDAVPKDGVVDKEQLNRMQGYVKRLKEAQAALVKNIEGQKELGTLKTFESIKQEMEDYTKSLEKTNKELEKYKATISKIKSYKLNVGADKKELQNYLADKNLNKQTLINATNNTKQAKDTVAKFEGRNDLSADDQQKLNKAQERIKVSEQAKEVLEEYNKSVANNKELLEKAQQAVENLTKDIKELSEKIEELSKEKGISQQQIESVENFGATIQDTGKSIEKTKKQMDDLGLSEAKVKTETDKTNTTIGKAAQSVVKYSVVVRTLKRILTEAVRAVEGIDEALTNMSVVLGVSKDSLYQYKDSLREVAYASGMAMTDVAEATTEFVRQGRGIQESILLTEQAAKAARIAGISITDSVTYLTSALKGFNLAVEKVSNVSDVFAKIASISATDYEQLAIALSKVSAQANQAGMSMEYTTALLAKGIETTQEAPESIGTALKTIVARFRELDDYGTVLEDGMNVNSVEKALSYAGISLRTATGEFKNLDVVLGELGPKWDTLNTMQQQSIAQAAAGTRQQSRFLAIMQDWNRTQELINESYDSEGASAYQAAKAMESITTQLTNLKTSWQGLIDSVTDSKLIIGAVKTLTSLLEGLSKFMQSFAGRGVMVATTIVLILRGITSAIMKIGELIAAVPQKLDDQSKKVDEIAKQWVGLGNKMAGAERQNKKVIEELLAEYEKYYNERKAREQELQDLQSNVKIANGVKEYEQKNNYESVKQYDDYQQKTTRIKEIEETGRKAPSGKIDSRTREGKEYKKLLEETQAIQKQGVITEEQYGQLKEKGVVTEKEYQELCGKELITAEQYNELKKEAHEVLAQQKIIEDEKQIILDKENETRQEIINKMYENNGLYTQELEKKLQAQGMNEQEAAALSQMYQYTLTINELEQQGILTQEEAAALREGEEIQDETKIKNLEKQTKEYRQHLQLLSQTYDSNNKSKGVMDALGKSAKKLTQNTQLRYKLEQGLALVLGPKTVAIGKAVLSSGKELIKNLLKEKATKEGINAETTFGQVLGVIRKKQEKDITKEQEKQAGAENISNVSKGIGNAENAIEEKQQKDITKEEEKQIAVEGTSVGLEAAKVSLEAANIAGVKGETAERKKGLITQILSTGLEAAKAAFEGPVGWISLAAGAAILAAVGIGLGIRAITGGGQSSKEDSITKNNMKSYETKEQNKKLVSSRDEYSALVKKGDNLTTEELERKRSIEQELYQDDDKYKGKTDQELLEALNNTISKNNLTIQKLTNSNYNSALKIDDLSSSTIGQKAITEKLIESNKDLIENNEELSEDQLKEIKNKTSTQLNNAMRRGAFDTESHKYTFGDFAKSFVGGALGVAVDLIKRNKERKESEAQRNALMNDFTNTVASANVEIATSKTMESKMKAYKKSLDEMEKLEKEYGLQAKILQVSFMEEQQGVSNFYKLAGDSVEDFAKCIDKLTEATGITADSLIGFSNKLDDIGVELGGGKEQQEKRDSLAYYLGSEKNINMLKKLGYTEEEIKEGLDPEEIRKKFLENNVKKDAYEHELTDKKGNYEVRSGSNKDWTEFIAGLEQFEGVNTKEDKLKQEFKRIYNKTSEERTNIIIKNLEDSSESNSKNFMDAYDELILSQEKIIANSGLSPKEQEQYLQNVQRLTLNELKQQVGMLDVGQFDDLITSMESSKDKAQEILSAVIEGGQLTSEQLNDLQNNYPQLMSDPEFVKQLTDNPVAAADKIRKAFLENREENIKTLENSILGFEKEVEIKEQGVLKLKEQLAATTNEDERANLEEQLKNEQNSLESSKAILNTKNAELETTRKLTLELKHYTVEELRILQLKKQIDSLDEQSVNNSRKKLEAQKAILQQLEQEAKQKYNTFIEQLGSSGFGHNKNYYKDILQLRDDGTLEVIIDKYEELSEVERQAITKFIEEGAFDDYAQAIKDTKSYTDELVDSIIESQNKMVSAYINSLEKENNAVKETLEKRKELYQEYFDAIDREEEEDTFTTDQAKLQEQITRLSMATDATSLSKLKSAQEQLAKLEEDKIKKDREERREAVINNIDEQINKMDETLEDLRKNTQSIIDLLNVQQASDVMNMLLNSEEYQSASDIEKVKLRRQYQDQITDFINSTGYNASDVSALFPSTATLPTTPQYTSIDTPGLIDYSRLNSVNSPDLSGQIGIVAESTDNTVNIVFNNPNITSEEEARELANIMSQAIEKSIRKNGININYCK